MNQPKPLPRDFYDGDALSVAEKLLGKLLVHRSPEGLTAGRIVELEAYMGESDKACHVYGGRRTPRTEILYGEGGHAYVYLIYGMYHCLNVTAGPVGTPYCILLRALEPIEGLALMQTRRGADKMRQLRQLSKLCSGPGKLCAAMGITRELYGEDLCGHRLWIEDDGFGNDYPLEIARGRRINIDYAEEAAAYDWRFAIKDSPFLSVKI